MKINIVGTSGSGKSTFARRLAEKLNHPYIEMDRIFWRPQWVGAKDEEFLSDLHAALSGEHWVLDGNYSRSKEVKWEKVEVVVWLDYSFTRTMLQAIRRAILRSLDQRELWTLQTRAKVRRKYEADMQDSRYSHIRFVRLRNPREAEEFLGSMNG